MRHKRRKERYNDDGNWSIGLVLELADYWNSLRKPVRALVTRDKRSGGSKETFL
jgi:hypothetical protein